MKKGGEGVALLDFAVLPGERAEAVPITQEEHPRSVGKHVRYGDCLNRLNLKAALVADGSHRFTREEKKRGFPPLRLGSLGLCCRARDYRERLVLCRRAVRRGIQAGRKDRDGLVHLVLEPQAQGFHLGPRRDRAAPANLPQHGELVGHVAEPSVHLVAEGLRHPDGGPGFCVRVSCVLGFGFLRHLWHLTRVSWQYLVGVRGI